MKIVLTLHSTLDINAGAASVILRLKDQYQRLGHQVEVLSYDDLPKISKKFVDIMFPLLVAWRVNTRYRKFDVIDAGSGDGWITFVLPKRPRRRLHVSHSHGLEPLLARREMAEARAAGIRPAMSKRLWRYGLRLKQVYCSFKHADLALVLNDSETDCLLQAGIDPAKIRRARLGMALPARDNPEAWTRDLPVIVQLGAYTARKGALVTRDAISGVLARHPDARMIFAGTGTDAGTVMADYPPSLYDRIAVISHYRNEELSRILQGAAILLMPSLFEGYGLVKLEAMARGVVPIVSDDPGSAMDMIDGINSLVVPVGDSGALEAAIERLLADRNLLAALAAAGLRTAANARWEIVARERLDLYREFLSGNAPG